MEIKKFENTLGLNNLVAGSMNRAIDLYCNINKSDKINYNSIKIITKELLKVQQEIVEEIKNG